MTESSSTPIRTLLIANRGEIARRIMRSAHMMGIECVAIFSDADAQSPFVTEADVSVRLPGSAPTDTYLSIDLLLDAAARTGADAVHPGYGFLSESAKAARAVVATGLIWVGPSPDAIDVMGSKVRSKEMMRTAGVPTLPSITLTEGDQLPSTAEADALGWPLLVKASAGGGGRGMRIIDHPDGLNDGIESARREALSAFGDGTVFLERYVTEPRHIEVQVVADHFGDTVALFERECSIQRRHQKIIEEAPSPFVTPELRDQLMAASVAAAKAVNYRNAGTVEFVVDRQGVPSFLEMNTRLQVEHPVTEAVTGLDLVRLQLLIASGHPLPDDVHAAVQRGPQGHAIEARLYAEDPAAGWLPSTGILHRFELPETTQIRVDSGVESGSVVSPHYDPMLAKVIAHAPTRDEAVRVLASSLAKARIHGVTTNRDLLVRTHTHHEFSIGATDTAFIERNGLETLAAPLADQDAVHRHAVAMAMAQQAIRRASATVQPGLPSGFRNSPSAFQTLVVAVGEQDIEVGYRFNRFGTGLEAVEIDGNPVALAIGTVSSTAVTITDNGVTRTYSVDMVETIGFVDGPDGSSVLNERDRFPVPGSQIARGSSLAPMPGGVVRVAVSVGDRVEAGQLLVVLEAMKMEHAVHATLSGTVSEVDIEVGDQIETGQTLVVVEPDEGSSE